MIRLMKAVSRWLVDRHELHRSHALMDRDLHDALNSNADLRKRNTELEWQNMEQHYRIRDLEQHGGNDWGVWEAELNGGP